MDDNSLKLYFEFVYDSVAYRFNLLSRVELQSSSFKVLATTYRQLRQRSV